MFKPRRPISLGVLFEFKGKPIRDRRGDAVLRRLNWIPTKHTNEVYEAHSVSHVYCVAKNYLISKLSAIIYLFLYKFQIQTKIFMQFIKFEI